MRIEPSWLEVAVTVLACLFIVACYVAYWSWV